ncbi:pyridoxamine 5'-phosphate oxidase [Alginatibacterium sediminis]|uniref:Pyridoxine/pyridoxamine 5'-phosphate oxidase n=1 Tax=Alginatibacterium sediminis TaxID=2164068 RepID=A0A420ED87_9ALTE|nr:pyridoxamine 5'-phosphate oxidase [Alginatibacterium sediminis]RKF18636.1 pyridoxamine 5'-phosphate oxidase [Alginatibacterium sediminis]
MSIFQKIRCAITLGQGVLLELPEPTGQEDPFELFDTWLEAAKDSGIILPESMNISSVSSQGRPSSRMVLLKDFDTHGFVFFTNYQSRKAQDLEQNGFASLNFHWNILQRQVRIEGRVERVSVEESKAYFDSRAKGSRIGAWASHQSKVLANREELEAQFKYYQDKFAQVGNEIPYPEFWGGYRIVPDSIEFWQGKASRLHDRFRYHREQPQTAWQVERLSP